MSETEHKNRLKRIYFRSIHRGNKEMDIVLTRFVDTELANLSPDMLTLYEQLLDEDDVNLWDWLISRNNAPTHYVTLLALIKDCQLSAFSA
jgi:antitoxin CptB